MVGIISRGGYGMFNVDYKRNSFNTLYKVIVVSSIIFYAFLLFFRINNRTMFIDESITAMLGQNIRKYFVPKVWDGRNLITASINGNEFNESLIYIKHNWLPYYLAAFCQLFGNDIIYMRIGFALIGLIGYLGYIFLVDEIFVDNIYRIISLVLYIYSVPIILFNRSIYYCAPALTFTIFCILFFIRCMKYNDVSNWLGLGISLVLQFHSLFLFCFVTIVTAGGTCVIYHSRKIKKMLIVIISSLMLCIPWYIYSALYLNKVTITAFVGIPYFVKLLMGYFWQIHAYFFPFLILVPLYFIFGHSSKLSNEYKSIRGIDGIIYNENDRNNNYRKDKYIWFFAFFQFCVNIIVICIFGIWINTRWLIA